MDIIVLLLNLIGLIFLVRYTTRLVLTYRTSADKHNFFTFRRFRYLIILSLLIGIPFLAANFVLHTIFPEPLFNEHLSVELVWWVAVGLALLISGVWIIYITGLDIYEPEKWIFLLLTFVLGCISTHYLCLWLYSLLDAQNIMLDSSDSLIYRFLYCVFAIGGIEEISKLAPVLILLALGKRAINEPYDYILYGSISALGFAFVENIDYLFYSRLLNIGGRALYAAVAHMAFTSILCYGIMLWRCRLTRMKGYIVIPLFFLLSVGAHGFYDFWLINEWVTTYSALTTLFFLITIHLWVTMKNNALNASPFFSSTVKLNNDLLRRYLIVALTGLLMLGYLIVALLDGRALANEYLFYRAVAYSYLIFYLAFGLSRYRLVQDQLRPLQVPFDFFIPKPVKG